MAQVVQDGLVLVILVWKWLHVLLGMEGVGIVSLLHIGILETSFSVVLGSSKLHLI